MIFIRVSKYYKVVNTVTNAVVQSIGTDTGEGTRDFTVSLTGSETLYLKVQSSDDNSTYSDSRSICLPAGGQTEVDFDMSLRNNSNNAATTYKLELYNYCYDGLFSVDRIINSSFEPMSFTLRPGIKVYYDGQVVGDFRADIIVDKRIIIELKAINALTIINSVQLVNYLTATGIDDGLLINFGAEHLEIKHKTRLYYKCQ